VITGCGIVAKRGSTAVPVSRRGSRSVATDTRRIMRLAYPRSRTNLSSYQETAPGPGPFSIFVFSLGVEMRAHFSNIRRALFLVKQGTAFIETGEQDGGGQARLLQLRITRAVIFTEP